MRPWQMWVHSVMRTSWPLHLILALAAFVQGWPAVGVVFLLLAATMFYFGRSLPDPPESSR